MLIKLLLLFFLGYLVYKNIYLPFKKEWLSKPDVQETFQRGKDSKTHINENDIQDVDYEDISDEE